MVLSVIKQVAKVVSPAVLRQLASEQGALQTVFLQFLCLQEKNLLSTYMKATSALHMITLKEAKNVASEALSKDNERGEKLRMQA